MPVPIVKKTDYPICSLATKSCNTSMQQAMPFKAFMGFYYILTNLYSASIAVPTCDLPIVLNKSYQIMNAVETLSCHI